MVKICVVIVFLIGSTIKVVLYKGTDYNFYQLYCSFNYRQALNFLLHIKFHINIIGYCATVRIPRISFHFTCMATINFEFELMNLRIRFLNLKLTAFGLILIKFAFYYLTLFWINFRKHELI